jgi:SnoaL-like domain
LGDGSLAKKAVSRYLELINSRRYSEIGSLFSDDAQFLAPTGEEIRGRESIKRFYSSGLERIRPIQVWASSQVTEGDTSVIEISATLADEPEHQARTVLDHFTVDAQGEDHAHGCVHASGRGPKHDSPPRTREPEE